MRRAPARTSPGLAPPGRAISACAINPSWKRLDGRLARRSSQPPVSKSAARERLGPAALDAQDLLLGPLHHVWWERRVAEVVAELLAVVDAPVQQPGERGRLRLIWHGLVGQDPGEARDRVGV